MTEVRIALHPARHARSVVDRIAALLRGLDGVAAAGRGQSADVHLYVGGLPEDVGSEQWWFEAVHSGVPAGSGFGALEIADRVPLTGLQLCAQRGGECVTLAEAWLRTDSHSPSRLVGRLWDAGLRMLNEAVLRRIDGTETPKLRSAPRQVELSTADRARLKARAAQGFTSTQHDETLRSDHWAIGVVEAPIHRFLEPKFRPEVVWSPDEGLEIFCADPFGVSEGGGVRLYYERFNFATDAGEIATRSYTFGGWGPEQKVLTGGSHLSYPHLIEHLGERFILPENGAAGVVAAYRIDGHEAEAPLRMVDFPALDSTVLEHDGKWWLFATDARVKHVDVLHIWFSEVGPLGPWSAHRLNPVKTDIRGTRPGGTPFRFGGALYRPAQDGTQVYGSSLAINRVDVLTPTDFRETTVRRMPPFSERPDGVHTLSAVGGRTLVDGKIRRIVPSTLKGRLRNKTRRLFELG